MSHRPAAVAPASAAAKASSTGSDAATKRGGGGTEGPPASADSLATSREFSSVGEVASFEISRGRKATGGSNPSSSASDFNGSLPAALCSRGTCVTHLAD